MSFFCSVSARLGIFNRKLAEMSDEDEEEDVESGMCVSGRLTESRDRERGCGLVAAGLSLRYCD